MLKLSFLHHGNVNPVNKVMHFTSRPAWSGVYWLSAELS